MQNPETQKQQDEFIKNNPVTQKLHCAATSLSETISVLIDQNSCLICATKQKEYALVPCGHLVLCSDCVEHYKKILVAHIVVLKSKVP